MSTPTWNGPSTDIRARKPLTPEELDALRPKPVVAESQPLTAKQIAYQSGVSALESVVLRIESLEAQVRELTARLDNKDLLTDEIREICEEARP